MIEEDGRYTCTISQIAYTKGISEGTVHRILTDRLKLKQLCARWVPYLLTPDQKSKRLDRAKKSQVIQSFLQQEKVLQLEHPSYFPDLCPSDFSYFHCERKCSQINLS